MAKMNLANYTVQPDEVDDVNQLIVEKVFTNSVLSAIHDVQTGIQHKQQISFVDRMPIGGETSVGCAPNEIGGLDFTEKFWDPALIDGRFSYCANDENKLFKILKQAQRANPDFFERLDSPELKLVIGIMTSHLEESILTKVWFSDTAAADIAGGGVFTNGTNLGIFNSFDGTFKKIFADADIKVHTIAKNAGANYAAQDLAAGDAHAILKKVYSNADSRLKSETDAQFLVTPDIWDNFLDTVEDKEFNGGIVTTLTDGRQVIKYRGHDIVKMDIWKRTIDKFQDDGVKQNMPHRVVFTTPSAIPVGTLSEKDLNEFDTHYNQTEKKNYIDYAYFLDAQTDKAYNFSVAY